MRAEAETKQTNEEIRQAAREHWLEYRDRQAGKSMDVGQEKSAELTSGQKQICHDILRTTTFFR